MRYAAHGCIAYIPRKHCLHTCCVHAAYVLRMIYSGVCARAYALLTHTCTHAYANVCTHAYTHAYLHTHTHLNAYAHACTVARVLEHD